MTLVDWEYQRDNYLIGDSVTGIVPAGTSVKEKIESLCSQTMISVWWDDEAQKIKLKAVGPTVTPAAQLNKAEHILDTGEKPQRDPTKAVTEVWVYFGRRNHATDEEEPKNYSNLYITPDSAATTGHGKSKIKKIFASDIPAGGTSTVNKLIARLLSQFAQGEFTYTFQLDIKDSALTTGDLAEITTDLIQDQDGYAALNSYIIIERDQIRPTVFQYRGHRTGFSAGTPYRLIAPDSMSATTYASASAGERETYGFIADNSTEQFSNSDDAHLIL